MANKKIIPVVDALKELYGKLGGTPEDVEDISTTTEMIQEITEVASPGGGGGGNSSLLLTYAYDEGVFTCDKTPSEILTAINNKKQILACLSEGSPVEVPVVQLVYSEDDEITGIDITFMHYTFGTSDVYGTTLEIEAIGLNHDVESEDVTLKISGNWEILPQE